MVGIQSNDREPQIYSIPYSHLNSLPSYATQNVMSSSYNMVNTYYRKYNLIIIAFPIIWDRSKEPEQVSIV